MSGEPVGYNSVHQRKFINSGANFYSELKKVTSGVGLAGECLPVTLWLTIKRCVPTSPPFPDTDRQDVFRVEAVHSHTRVSLTGNRSNR